jgi:hypothetical protein
MNAQSKRLASMATMQRAHAEGYTKKAPSRNCRLSALIKSESKQGLIKLVLRQQLSLCDRYGSQPLPQRGLGERLLDS